MSAPLGALADSRRLVISMAMDVTERKRAEEELRKNENLLRRIFDILPVGLWFADKTGKLQMGNPAGVRIWGGEPTVGQEDYGVFRARRLPSREEVAPEDWALAHTVNEGVTVSDELLEIDAFDGQPRTILNYTAPVLDADGQIEGAVVVNLDVTDRMAAEAETRRRASVDAALAELSSELLRPGGGNVDVAALVLRLARALTGSAYGFVSTIDSRTGEAVDQALDEYHQGSEALQSRGGKFVFRAEDGHYPGLYGYALDRREAFYTNDPTRHPASVGVPVGHFVLERFLAVPVMAEDQLLGLIALANSPSDYDDRDLETIRRLAELYGLFLRDLRTKEALRQSQERLSQAEKMEAVGRLAGGVAHDSNNMLQSILGYSEMALEELSSDSPVYGYVVEVQKAGRRSADLTRQLLAFARRQTIQPRALDLNDAVTGMLKMLGRLVGEDIELVWKPASGVWQVLMDPSQVDQILANLVVNARDAIAGVGHVVIETENKEIAESYCEDHSEATPGEYVALWVSDDGCGMDRDTLGQVFEPFFTTKPVGEGTGLGLATIYGIIKQNNGFINVYSEPGQGTTQACACWRCACSKGWVTPCWLRPPQSRHCTRPRSTAAKSTY